MYCTKCGKEIESGIICDECLAKDQARVETAPQRTYVIINNNEPKENEDRMLGFGKALSSTILSFVGLIFACVAYFFALMGASTGEDTGVGAIALVIFSLPFLIISLVQGIKSIGLFKRTVGKKPIATLILGINGTYTAAMGLLFAFLSLLIGVMSL